MADLKLDNIVNQRPVTMGCSNGRGANPSKHGGSASLPAAQTKGGDTVQEEPFEYPPRQTGPQRRHRAVCVNCGKALKLPEIAANYNEWYACFP